jgi:hypothetical protein
LKQNFNEELKGSFANRLTKANHGVVHFFRVKFKDEGAKQGINHRLIIPCQRKHLCHLNYTSVIYLTLMSFNDKINYLKQEVAYAKYRSDFNCR